MEVTERQELISYVELFCTLYIPVQLQSTCQSFHTLITCVTATLCVVRLYISKFDDKKRSPVLSPTFEHLENTRVSACRSHTNWGIRISFLLIKILWNHKRTSKNAVLFVQVTEMSL